MSDPAQAYDMPGWPRPWATWEPAGLRALQPGGRMPVPWINGRQVLEHGWLRFRPDAQLAHEHRLCAICGTQLNATIVLGALNATTATSGPGGHPRCMALAATTCPHLTAGRHGDPTVAWAYTGPGVGYEVLNARDALYSSDLVVDAAAAPLTRRTLAALAATNPEGHAS